MAASNYYKPYSMSPAVANASTNKKTDVLACQPESSSSSSSPSSPTPPDDVPMQKTCPHCQRTVVTQVELETSWVTLVVALIMFSLLGWVTFCVLPFLWPVLQDVVHHCPRCLNRISRQSCISVPSIRQEVVTVKCGRCAVVLSRKYVFVLTGMSVLITFVYGLRWYAKHVGLPDIEKGELIEDSWPEFAEHCGIRTSLGNPIHAVEEFSTRYNRKRVHWDGRVNRIKEGIWSNNFLFVDMSPSQFRLPEMPDLALMFSKGMNSVVRDLKPGDRIDFEATLLELGRRGQPHYGVLRNCTALPADPDDGMLMPGLSIFRLHHPLDLFHNMIRHIHTGGLAGDEGGEEGPMGGAPMVPDGVRVITSGGIAGGGPRIVMVNQDRPNDQMELLGEGLVVDDTDHHEAPRRTGGQKRTDSNRQAEDVAATGFDGSSVYVKKQKADSHPHSSFPKPEGREGAEIEAARRRGSEGEGSPDIHHQRQSSNVGGVEGSRPEVGVVVPEVGVVLGGEPQKIPEKPSLPAEAAHAAQVPSVPHSSLPSQPTYEDGGAANNIPSPETSASEGSPERVVRQAGDAGAVAPVQTDSVVSSPHHDDVAKHDVASSVKSEEETSSAQQRSHDGSEGRGT